MRRHVWGEGVSQLLLLPKRTGWRRLHEVRVGDAAGLEGPQPGHPGLGGGQGPEGSRSRVSQAVPGVAAASRGRGARLWLSDLSWVRLGGGLF